jgi:hypothetical protein
VQYSSSGVRQWIQTYVGVGAAFDEATSLAVGTDGNVFVSGVSANGVPSIFTTVKYVQATITAAPKVFLEGPYNQATDAMNTTLRSSVLPARFTSLFIPSKAVDSITIEIRDQLTAAGSTIRRFAQAWLLADGTVRNFTDTTKAFVEFDAPVANYYIVIWHRNHLAVMSSTNPLLKASPPTPYDFSTALSQAYLNGQKQIDSSPLRFGMFTGDANGDGQVTGSDFNVFDTAFRNAQTGYRLPDWNLDGQVTGSDFNLFDTNFRAAASSKVP